jgi:hypothetical protein
MATDLIQSSQSSCCGDDCCYKYELTGCAAGVPYVQVAVIGVGSTPVIRWINLNTGDIVSTKPTDFLTGTCADAGINVQTCYQIGSDKYSVFRVNGVTTYFKNGVLVSGTSNIDAAVAAIASATYSNVIDCNPQVPQDVMTCYTKGTVEYAAISQNGVTRYYDVNKVEITGAALTTLLADIASGAAVVGCCTQCLPEVVPEDTSTCYQKVVTTPPIPGSEVFTVQSGFPNRVPIDGSGPLQETVYTVGYTTGNEVDGQYSLRDGANNHSGSPGSWAIAYNFGISSPTPPYKVYSQKLIGTPGKTYRVGYWARDRATPLANFRVDVKDGATIIATGTSGAMSTTYTNYQSGSFVMPAGGEVTMELTNLVFGNANGNDPLLDDIGLWEITAAVPGTTTITTYRKTVSNGVTTYYDENGAPVTGAALTTLLADIAAGVYDVVPCSAGCACTVDDIFTGGTNGQVWTVQPDGSYGWSNPSTQAILDNQVLTGATNTNTTVVLTPTTVADESGGTQVNYTISASVKVDGTTIVEDPTTKVLSAANQKPDVLTTAQTTPTATGNTTNLNTIFADAAGNTWFVDFNGDAILLSAAKVTCKGAHYQQLTLVAGVAQTITHTFGMTNARAIGYSVLGVNGTTVGDWPTGVRFINHTANSVDIIADGIGGIVDVALWNTECLSSVAK